MSPLSIQDLAVHANAMPVCRVHIYGAVPGSDQVPVHWAGRPELRAAVGATRPKAVVGVGGWEGSVATASEWQVLSARTNETRQWSCSSAQFQVAHPMNAVTLPQLPPVKPNDCIVIEMGYVRSIQSRINEASGNTYYGNFSGDVVFYGKVDEVKERGGSGEQDGIVFTVSCRDMLSFLVDNKIRGHYRPSENQYNRAYVVRDLIYRGAAIEYVEYDAAADGTKTFKTYQAADGQPNHQPGMLVPRPYGPDNCYVRLGLQSLELSTREDVAAPDPKVVQDGIVLMDRFPLDVIKHFSLVETAPRELWSDRRTGEIRWMFRRTDARRLNQAEGALHRQYFYRFPAKRANIISYTNEWTTLGTITHFTVTNPLSSVSGTKAASEIYAESPSADLKDPHTGESLRRMTRNRFVYDDTLAQSENAKGESIAAALFTIWGRAIETGMVMVPGDPTLEIGEAVQLFNTGLFGRRFWEGADPADADAGRYTRDAVSRMDASGRYADALADKPNPEGIYRVEAVSNLFALGGVSHGYTTVFIFGPIDPPGVGQVGGTSRLVTTDAELAAIQFINPADKPLQE